MFFYHPNERKRANEYYTFNVFMNWPTSVASIDNCSNNRCSLFLMDSVWVSLSGRVAALSNSKL